MRMDGMAKAIAIVRDLVWTTVGVLLLVVFVIVLAGGGSGLLSAGAPAGNGTGAGPVASGQAGGNPPAPVQQPATPGSQGPGPGSPPPPGPGSPPPGPGSTPPPAQNGLTVSGSETFAGSMQGSNVSGNLQVNATQGSLQNSSLSMSVSSAGLGNLTFMGSVSCMIAIGANPLQAVVGGSVTNSSDQARLPKNSGFVVGVLDASPQQVAFEAGFAIADPAGLCANESSKLFTPEHPGLAATGGHIDIH